MADEVGAIAGWYPDAENPGGQRYWDGQHWTENRVAPPPPPTTSPASPGQTTAESVQPPDQAEPGPTQPTGQTEAPGSQSPQTDVGRVREAPATLKERALALPPRQVVAGALISTGALALGSIGPWATATVFGVSESVGGLHGGGWVTLITATVGAIVLFDPRFAARVRWVYQRRRGLWRVLLWISLVVCFLNLANVEHYGLAGTVHPGWGLYLATIAVVVCLAADWVLRVQARESTPVAPGGPH